MSNGLLNDLIAYWKCDEASGVVMDTTAANLDLAGVVDEPTRGTGIINNGAQFNSNNTVAENADSALNFRQNPMVSFTVSMWIKPNAVKTSGSTWMWEQYDGAGNEGWGLVMKGQDDPDTWNFFMRHGAGTISCPSNAANVPTGSFTHVVLRYDASTGEMALFIDNDKTTADASGLQVVTAGTVAFTLGGWAQNGSENANAIIDEIGAWSDPLTDTQVSQLYNSGAALAYSSFDASTPAAGDTVEAHSVAPANKAPVFSRHIPIVTGHLEAVPLDAGTAAITVLYIEEDL
jgi:hypothetical protein